MKINVLRIVRTVALIPLILLLGYAVFRAFTGYSFLSDTVYRGFNAFILVVLLYASTLSWLWLVCILLIILTTILIRKQR